MCHFSGYDFTDRIEQLKVGNFKWAATSASGLGRIDGSVMNGQTPRVVYNKRLFNEDGTVAIEISWPPPDDNCLFCHSMSDVKKRGFTWNDEHNPDVHNQQGLRCVSCHPADLDHQILKGNEAVGTVRDDLDNTMKSCEQCHMSGYMGATVPKHENVRPSHLKKLACESCHIPEIHRAAGSYFDASSGKLVWETMPPGYGSFSKLASWKPTYERRADGKIYPMNPIMAIWWGNRGEDGIVYPLFTREVARAYNAVSGSFTDDDENGRPEINTRDEIMTMMAEVKTSIENSKRFSVVDPVFVKGGYIYYLDEAGELVYEHDHIAESHNFSINHNVAPARMALGANGCADCHAGEAHFFKGLVLVDPLNMDNEVVYGHNGEAIGCKPWIFQVNALHQQFGSPFVSFSIVIVVFFVMLHYHSYGPKRIEFHPGQGDIQRFTRSERIVHLGRLMAFVVLAVTGLIFAFNLVHWQTLLFSTSDTAYSFHMWFGFLFILTTLAGTGLWFRDAIFASYDKAWVKLFGGYLGAKEEVPAGRFNAGQKVFYWYTTIFGLMMALTGLMLVYKEAFPLGIVCLTSTIHNFVGLLLIAGVLSHAYLGTVANPGTWQVLVDGVVSRTWAKHHHPNWYRELLEKGVIQKADAAELPEKSGDAEENRDEETPGE